MKLKDDGTVKVLDYGLAKAFEGDARGGVDSELSQSPTLTRHGTRIGVILGTAAYISPEQAKGKRVDKRTDIWAFGAVVYEMLTGKRAFAGDDVSDTLAAVLRAEPDFDALPADTPNALGRLLRPCLSKDVKGRVRDIGDVRLVLEGAFETQPTDAAPVIPSPGARWTGRPCLLASIAVGGYYSDVGSDLVVVLDWFEELKRLVPTDN